jgi:hypothetical protein
MQLRISSLGLEFGSIESKRGFHEFKKIGFPYLMISES